MRPLSVAIGLVLVSAAAFAAIEQIEVVNEGGIREKWTLPVGFKLATPANPSGSVEKKDEVCVGLGYLIRADGTTSDFALLKSWTSAEVSKQDTQRYWAPFAQASADALAQWRFEPKPGMTPEPVYTVATFLFNAKSPELRRRCAILNLVHHLTDLRQDRAAFRQMNASGIFDRLELNRAPADRAKKTPGMRGY